MIATTNLSRAGACGFGGLGTLAIAAMLAGGVAYAQTTLTTSGTVSGSNPRVLQALAGDAYGSLVTDRVDARSAPGLDHAVVVIFKRAGLPVRLLDAARGWQRVEDVDGTKGWVRADMVSRRRTALVIADGNATAQAQIIVRASPQVSADVVALLEPGVIVGLTSCNGQVCKVSASNVHGFMDQRQLWGVGASEIFH